MDTRDLEALKWAAAILRECVDKRFYGSVTIQIEDGQIKRAEKKESLKP